VWGDRPWLRKSTMCTWARLRSQLTREATIGAAEVVVRYGEREGQSRVAQSPGHEPPVVARAQQPVQTVSCVSCWSMVHYCSQRPTHKKKVPDEVSMGLLVLAAAQRGGKAGLVGAGQR